MKKLLISLSVLNLLTITSCFAGDYPYTITIHNANTSDVIADVVLYAYHKKGDTWSCGNVDVGYGQTQVLSCGGKGIQYVTDVTYKQECGDMKGVSDNSLYDATAYFTGNIDSCNKV